MDVASQNRFQDLMQASVFKVHPKLFLLVGGCSKANIVDITQRCLFLTNKPMILLNIWAISKPFVNKLIIG